MARKKQEIALQTEIETQEEWEEMLAKEGLTIVDVYQEWAGPCKAMVSNLRRIKNELGDDLLRFSVAKADTVDALERYRGRCQPCFLFFAGGCLVEVLRGANSPKLLMTLTEQLSYEHKVLEGNAERKEIKDTALGEVAGGGDAGFDDDEDEEGGETKKSVTVAILKPNLVRDGKVDEVVQKMKEAGIDILEKQERTLTDEEAREFYSHQSDKDFFESLVSYMISGPSVVLVITKGETGEGIIEEWRELLGPPSVEEAKSNAPESLRATYGGDEDYVNSVHGSDSADRAMTELAFFFPDFAVPTVQGKRKAKRVQRTLALIRPDAMREKKDEILAKVNEAGFMISMQKEITLTKDQAEEFYKEHEGQDYFEELTTRMSSGPLLALALAREEAVEGWRNLLGPKEVDKAKEEAPESLRAQFSVEDTVINQLHGSDSPTAAEKELNFFFPMQQTVAVVKPDAFQTKEEIMEKIKEAGFHIAARKETDVTLDIAKQFYKDLADQPYYDELTDHMTSGPTLFMVLSREDAVDGWRSIIGPTDPEKAKEQNPECIRAQFGQSIKENAVHGSSTTEHAKDSIKLVFGDMEFNNDGTVSGADQQEEEKQTEEERPASADKVAEEAAAPETDQKPAEEPAAEESAQEEEQKPAQQEEDAAEESKPEAEPQKEEEQEPEAAPETKEEEQQEASEQKEEEPAEEQKADETTADETQEEQKEGGEESEQKTEEEAAPQAETAADDEGQAAASDQQKEEDKDKKDGD